MLPAASSAPTPSIEQALKFAGEANALAATLAALTAKVRLIRVQHAIRVATLAS